MPPKSRQHVIPRVYLKAFCDPAPPPDHPTDTPFTPGVWVTEKDRSRAPYRRAPDKLFVERNAYTLRSDAPGSPAIEEWLARVETGYATVLRKLRGGEPVTPTEWGDLFLFVGALHARTMPQVSHWQRQMEELERVTRMVERGHTGKESYSDTQFVDWDEVGRRSVRDRAESFAEVLTKGAVYLVENESELPFVSSDTPVTLVHVFGTFLERWGFPREQIRDLASDRRLFTCVCPLTPRLALFASHLAGSPGELRRMRTNDEYFIRSLVWLTAVDADAVLIAHTPRPLPDAIFEALEEQARQARELREAERFARCIIVAAPAAQLVIPVSELAHEHEGLRGVLRFRTEDMDVLRAAADVGTFVELEYRDGDAGGGMRNAYFESVAVTPDGESFITQRL